MGIFEQKVPMRQYAESLSKVQALQKENQQLSDEIERLNRKIKDNDDDAERRKKYNNKKKQEREEKEEEERERAERERKEKYGFWDNIYIEKFKEFYKTKKDFFPHKLNRVSCEQNVYYCLNQIFSKSNDEMKRYVAFPHVRVADIVNGNVPFSVKGYCKKEYREKFKRNFVEEKFEEEYNKFNNSVSGKITSIHVDFIVCLYVGVGKNSSYTPALAIEVYGPEHFRNVDEIKDEKGRNEIKSKEEKDKRKKEIFELINLPFMVIKNEEVEFKNLTKVVAPELERKIFQLIDRV
jgi:hypothetical protein